MNFVSHANNILPPASGLENTRFHYIQCTMRMYYEIYDVIELLAPKKTTVHTVSSDLPFLASSIQYSY